MRKVLALVLVSALSLGCGGGSSHNSGPTPLAGKFGGKTFTPTDAQALIVGSGTTPCTQVPLLGTAGVKAIALHVTSYANACADFTSSTCAYHADAQMVTVVLAKIATASQADPTPAEPTIGTGTYTISSSMAGAQPDPTHAGWLVVAFAQALATGAAPTCSGTPELAQSGSLTLTSISSTAISGSVSLTFASGDSLAGDFSAVPVCSQTPDVCGLAQTQQLCDPTNATCT